MRSAISGEKGSVRSNWLWASLSLQLKDISNLGSFRQTNFLLIFIQDAAQECRRRRNHVHHGRDAVFPVQEKDEHGVLHVIVYVLARTRPPSSGAHIVPLLPYLVRETEDLEPVHGRDKLASVIVHELSLDAIAVETVEWALCRQSEAVQPLTLYVDGVEAYVVVDGVGGDDVHSLLHFIDHLHSFLARHKLITNCKKI